MTDAEILTVVKQMLFGTSAGTFRDDLLNAYIVEIKDFMRAAGVQESVIISRESVGVIALGVSDLWNYQSGGVKLSEYFKQRVIQLSRKDGEPVPVVNRTEFRRYTDYIKTTAESTTNISFYIPEYDSTTDAEPNVYINGMLAIKETDYSIDGNEITFVIPKIAGTEIFVVVEKCVETQRAGE